MSDKMVNILRQRLQRTHGWILQSTEELAEEQLAWIPSPTAPPIRWHVWHVARCADLGAAEVAVIVASSPTDVSETQQIWYVEKLA